MTDLLEKAFAAVRTLSPEAQDDLAHMLLAMADDSHGNAVALTPEELADLAEAERQADRGEFATEDEMRAIWAKYRR